MRLAVITQSRDRVGGVEAYLESVIPALAQRHEVAFWSADSDRSDRGVISLPPSVTVLASGRPQEEGVRALHEWQPHLLFAHGLQAAALEAEVLAVAPAVIVEHTYHGTCISSTKTMSWPAASGCERRFGAACLALYFPRRCGGMNPMTMVSLYRAQSRRLESLRNASAVVTLSAHMAGEMLRHGVPRSRVHLVRPFVVPRSEELPCQRSAGGPVQLLFMGRLEPLKGVGRLLAALEFVARSLARPVRLVVVGEGAERGTLEAEANSICARNNLIDIRFAGWQDERGKAMFLSETDAIVVPSLWPEPFGLVGLEAAAVGVPAVAFATGGIPEWLHENKNGCLAPAAGARPEALADAIVRCVGNAEVLARLQSGARAGAARWTLDDHLAALERIFETVLRTSDARGFQSSLMEHAPGGVPVA